jgi:hypothetical protein
VVAGLKARRHEYAEFLCSGGTTFREADATAMKTADIIGRISEVDNLIQLLTEDQEDDRDREDNSEGT